jgi:hypothetical protein
MRCLARWEMGISWCQRPSPDRNKRDAASRLVGVPDKIRWPPGWGFRSSNQSRTTESPISPTQGATDEVRGEGGCFFDEIQDLFEPTERRDMDASAGPQRGRMPERRGPESRSA